MATRGRRPEAEDDGEDSDGTRTRADRNEAQVLNSREEIAKATGTHSPRLQQQLAEQLYRTISFASRTDAATRSQIISAAIDMLAGIAPRDEMEGALAVQMVATHQSAMDCLGRAMHADQTFHGRELNLKYATKLLGIYTRQMEALNKNRGKGQQKVTVEHVHVNEGGQAIVGNVEEGASPARAQGRDRREPRTVGPDAKAIEHQPGETLEMAMGDQPPEEEDVVARKPRRSRGAKSERSRRQEDLK